MKYRRITKPLWFATLLFVAGTFACGDGETEPEPDPNRAPTTVGNIQALTLVEGQSETVDVSSFFTDPDGDNLSYSASSSDVAVLTVSVSGSNLTATAVSAGTVVVTVTATDPDGLSASHSVNATVQSANQAPELGDTIPDQELAAGDTVALDVSGNFSDPDGDTLTYTAESSDTAAATVSVDGSGVTIVALEAGSAEVTVTATDPGDLSAMQTFTVTVAAANQAPELGDTIPDQELAAGDTVALDVSGNFSDPDGDTLTYTAESSDTAAATVSVDGSGVTIVALEAGSAEVTVTATDPGDLSAMQTFTVTVAAANRAPELGDTIPDQELTAGDTVALDVSGNFSDPDGDTLTYTAESSDTAAATVSVDSSGVTIVALEAGSAEVTVTATDPGDLSAMQTFTVTVAAANQAPELGDTIPDQELTAGDTVALDVSGNFSDPDGDALTYTAESSDTAAATVSVDSSGVTIVALEAGSAEVTVTATDPGDLSAMQAFTVTVAAANRAPELGDTIPDQELTAGDTVALDVSGNFSDPDGDTLTYTAESGDTAAATVSVDSSGVTIVALEAGSAEVTVTATDPGDLSAMQTFTVTVAAANRAPELGDTIPDQELAAGDTVALDVSGNFSDPDGDTLTYTAESSDTAAATVSVDSSGVTIVALEAGSAEVTVTATDPGDLSAMQTFTVTVAAANQAPELGDTIPDQELTAGDTVALDVSGNFSDPDGDALTYTAESSDTAAATVSVDSSGVTIVALEAGSAEVTVTATDPGDLSAMQAFTVTVAAANRAPELGDTIPDQELTAGDTVALDVSGNFSDPDGDTLTYTAESGDTAAATVSVDSSGVTIVALEAGSAEVTVTATDPGDLSAMQTFTVTVAAANQAPELGDTIPDQELTAGDTVALDVSGNFSDPDGDALTYTAESSDTAAATVSVDSSGVTIVALEAGSAEVTVTATDPGDLSAMQTFTVTVAAANRAPELGDTIPDQELTAGDTVALDVSGNFSDPDGDTLTYTAESGDTAAATVSMDSSGVTIVALEAGSAEVTVTATDPGDLSAMQTFTVTVAAANRAPELGDTIPDQELTAGDTVALDVSGNFSDPDGDTLTYTAESGDTAAATVSVDSSGVTIVALEAGSAEVTVTATDPGDLSAMQTFTVTVAAANRAPEITDTMPVHDLLIVLDTADMTDTLTMVVLDMADYFSDPDDDSLTYKASTSDTSIAKVESVEGSVVTTIAVASDTMFAPATTMLMVTATDTGGLSVTQESMVLVANADYEVWEGLMVRDDGRITLQASGITYTFGQCAGVNNLSISPYLLTAHWTAWQVKRGTGWVTIPGTYKELQICPYLDLPNAPAGTYRWVGEVSIRPSSGTEDDWVRSRRKSNDITRTEN